MTTATGAGIGALIETINELETEAHQSEAEPSDIRWAQAEQVAAALAAGMSTRKLAAKWISAETGEPLGATVERAGTAATSSFVRTSGRRCAPPCSTAGSRKCHLSAQHSLLCTQGPCPSSGASLRR